MSTEKKELFPELIEIVMKSNTEEQEKINSAIAILSNQIEYVEDFDKKSNSTVIENSEPKKVDGLLEAIQFINTTASIYKLAIIIPDTFPKLLEYIRNLIKQ